ncbi:MAG: FliM/FliN family flagellar motor switch protein [Planctomycetota bacterium]
MGRTLNSLLKIEVPVIVRLGSRQMKMSEITALTSGSIIEFPIKADEPLELLANNIPIGSGMAVKVAENFGISLDYVGDIRDRIAALGSERSGMSEEDEDAAAAALAEQFLNG